MAWLCGCKQQVQVAPDQGYLRERLQLGDGVGNEYASAADVAEALGTNVRRLYRRGRRLGVGSFASVYALQHRRTKAHFALKLGRRDKHSEAELRALFALGKHPHVLTVVACELSTSWVRLVLPLCACDLHTFITDLYDQEDRHLTEAEAARVLFGVISALDYCHRRGLAHLDLKPNNVMLAIPARALHAQLGDFGSSCQHQGVPVERPTSSSCVCMWYAAPELFEEKLLPAAVDMWGVGGILFTMLSGEPPFDGPTQAVIQHRVQHDAITLPPEIRECSPECQAFVLALLTRDVAARLTAAEALGDIWLVSNAKRARSWV
eukprot:m.9548 g.9548  ORF g.9548 m.9548 type:complete len:321 (-) comp2985_c0_seq1:225-1187(-)